MANQNVKAEKIHFSGRTSSDFEYDASNMFQKHLDTEETKCCSFLSEMLRKGQDFSC